MDKEIIQQIATEVVHRLPYGDHPWLFLLVTAILMALAAGSAAWTGAFLKIKGQNFATKRDFEELQKQLKANTETVEAIKSEVGQRDWARREWTNLRRIKLEALMEKTHECETELDRRRNAALEGLLLKEPHDPFTELDAICDVYFPELHKETADFTWKCRAEVVSILELRQKLLRAGDDMSARQSAMDNFQAQFSSPETRPQNRWHVRDTLRGAARSLLKRIMNVDEGATRSDGG